MTRLSLLALLLANVVVHATPLVMLEYRDKPPYSYTEEGKPRGFLLERTLAIFKRAGVPVVAQEVPAKRITFDIQNNAQPICSTGWYKLPEREAYARFTQAVHQDKPHVVLAGTHAAEAVRRNKTLRALLANPALSIGVVDGVSYGQELDQLITTLPTAVVRSTVVPLQMAKMIQGKRADYMLIDQDDLAFLVEKGDLPTDSMAKIEFPDMPAGLKRYIMCSKQVPEETVTALNEAIRLIVPSMK